FERISAGYTYRLASNPYRATNDPTMGWTRTKVDQMGRTVEVTHFSNATKPSPWESNSTSTGTSTVSYDSDQQTATDEASVHRRTTVDGLQRSTQVEEGGTPASTIYTYDLLNNLNGVNQSGQLRSFQYSSLGRLTSATNPESGTSTYGYYDNGSLKFKIDARGARSDQVDDHLSRVATTTHNDGTPTVTYAYAPNGVANDPVCSGANNFRAGRLSSVSSTASSYEYKCYDSLGRVQRSTQTTNGQSYTFSYTYKVGGMLESITYPSNRV